MDEVNDYYAAQDEGTRLSRNRARSIEFLTTMRYIRRFIGTGSEVVDIGAGNGIYAFELAKACKSVYAIDLAENHIREIDRKIAEEGITNVRSRCGSILDRGIAGSYDLALCLGPYYHLRTKAERIECLEKCRSMLKPGGVLFVSYINRDAVVYLYLRNGIFMDDEAYRFIRQGDYDRKLGFDPFMDIAFYSSPEEVEAELREAGLSIEGNIGVDGLYRLLDAEIEGMDEARWDAFIRNHFESCERRSAVGLSNHGLAICVPAR